MILEKSNPIGDILASLVTAYGMTQQAKKQKADRERQAQQDQQAATEAALRGQYEQSEIGRNNAELAGSGFDPTGKRLPNPTLPPSLQKLIDGNKELSPEQVTQVAMGYATAGRPDLAKTYLDATTTGAERIANRDYTQQGRLPLAQEQVKALQDKVKNGFKQQWELLQARLSAPQRARAVAAYRRAGGGSGNSEREAQAFATALNVANGREYQAANSAARDQYNEQMDNYRRSYDTKSGQYREPEPQAPAAQAYPPINIVLPGTNTVIQVDPQTHKPIPPPPPPMPFIPPPLRKKSGPADVGATSNYQARPPGAVHGKNAQGVPGWQYPDGSFHPDN